MRNNWVLPLLGTAAIALGLIMSINLVSPALIIGGYIILLIEIFRINKIYSDAQSSKPVIELSNFGFEIKEWKDSRPSVCAYIDVKNRPTSNNINDVNSKGVYPTITWTGKQGDVSTNNGRWWIPTEDQIGAISQQTVDLEANGMPRRLHFSYSIMQNMGLQAMGRTPDDKMSIKMRNEYPYELEFHLRDKTPVEERFYFRLTAINEEAWPNLSLRLQRLSKKGGNVLETRNFNLIELDRFEKEKGYKQ